MKPHAPRWVLFMTLALLVASGGPSTAQSPEATDPGTSAAPTDGGATPTGRCGPGAHSHSTATEIMSTWMAALWSFYQTGDAGGLDALATDAGVADLAAVDWRYGAVQDMGLRFIEVPELVDFYDEQAWCSDPATLVRLQLDPIIDVAAGARTIDAAVDLTLERTDGPQRRSFSYTFIAADDGSGWLLDAVAPPSSVPRFPAAPISKPCPGLKNPAQAKDPFLMVPWCTANGDGRLVVVNHGRREIGIGRPACWPGAVQLHLGLPPGTVEGYDNVKTYVRDPRGTVKGANGFRRNVRPPKDAISTGITNGYATIWTSKSLGDNWLLLQVGDRFERWPEFEDPCPGM